MNNLSLHTRISVVLIFITAFAILQIFFRATNLAQSKVMEEVDSITVLLNTMFSLTELSSASPFSTDTEPAFLRELVELENIRNIDIRIDSTRVDYPQVNTPPRENTNAPGWFVSMVYPEDIEEIRSFAQSNGDVIRIYPDPSDEIEEVWSDIVNRFTVAMIFLIVMLGLLYFLIRHWMKGLDIILEVLENVEQGDFSRRIPNIGLPEFDRVGDSINHLATVLGSSKSENERLTRKSVTVQERERRHLAQELHDSMGQSVSAIKAIAVSIAERSRQTDPTSAKSAKNIEDIADSTYESVRLMMTNLRPSVLDELGLNEALKQMVDDWNIHHEDTFCRLTIEGDYSTLEDEQQINVYRIVQEGLTNISKHAKAENVSITLSGREIISLLIVDDGVGFSVKDIIQEMGLTSIRDRATLLQGDLQVDSKPGSGVSIQIEFPRLNFFRRRAGDL